jgi:Domain of unknown function (DUF4386)
MENFKRIGAGICFIIVPLVLILAFAGHPNLTDLKPPGSDAQSWIGEFHNNTMWRVAHVAAMFAALLIAVMFLEWMRLLKDKAPLLSFVAGVLGIVGCFMLAADKGALALVPTAFDTLPEEQFQQLLPGIQAMIEHRGWLWMVQLYLLLPLGLVLMGIALVRSKAAPRWQGLAIVVGAVLLFNPDIDLISLVASIVLAIGMIPMGLALIASGQSEGPPRRPTAIGAH